MSVAMWRGILVLVSYLLASTAAVASNASPLSPADRADTCTFSFVVPDTYGACSDDSGTSVLGLEVATLRRQVSELTQQFEVLVEKLGDGEGWGDYGSEEEEEDEKSVEVGGDGGNVPMVTASPCSDEDIFVVLGCQYDSSHESVVTFVPLKPTPFEVKNVRRPGHRGFNFRPNYSPFPVFCSVDNWIVIQRRYNGFPLSFNRSMADYVNGFGDLKGEFWLGLEKVNQITSSQFALYELRAEATGSNGASYFIQYNNFEVESAATGYRMQYLSRTITSSASSGNLYENVPFQAANTTCSRRENGGWFSGSACLANLYSSLNANSPRWGKSGSSAINVIKTVVKIRPILH